MSKTRAAIAGVVAILTLAACGSGTGAASPPTSSAPPSPAANVATISRLTKMVCASEAEEDIADALGTQTSAPLAPTWIDHNYSCRYVYPHGVMRLSVKQLPDAQATRRYVKDLGAQLGRRQTLDGLGEVAFTTANSSVVVQKDEKVLVVDVHGLPARFGVPPDSRANVAISVAATILGCWTGG